MEYVIEPGEGITVNFADHKDWICSKVSNGVAILFPDGTHTAYVYAVPVDKIEFEEFYDDGGKCIEFYCSVGDCRQIPTTDDTVTYLD